MPHLSDKKKDEVIRDVKKRLGGLLGIMSEGIHDENAEFAFTALASSLGLDRKRPKLIADKFPLPCSTATTRTSDFVWKWADIKEPLIKEVLKNAIIDLADAM